MRVTARLIVSIGAGDLRMWISQEMRRRIKAAKGDCSLSVTFLLLPVEDRITAAISLIFLGYQLLWDVSFVKYIWINIIASICGKVGNVGKEVLNRSSPSQCSDTLLAVVHTNDTTIS